MTSSRDCDVTSRAQNFKNYFMAHGKRLSINQYRADLSTVFRLDFISCRRGMGISVSIYLLFSILYIYIILQNQKVCWLLTYHDSFISTLQIYAQKKEYKRYHSNFYHIDSTLTPHRFSTVLTPGGF